MGFGLVILLMPTDPNLYLLVVFDNLNEILSHWYLFLALKVLLIPSNYDHSFLHRFLSLG